jgi:hypothetical protein
MKDFREARPSQTITLCGVNAHFKNGITEKRIRIFENLPGNNFFMPNPDVQQLATPMYGPTL